jgi:hypothetical protein
VRSVPADSGARVLGATEPANASAARSGT